MCLGYVKNLFVPEKKTPVHSDDFFSELEQASHHFHTLQEEMESEKTQRLKSENQLKEASFALTLELLGSGSGY